jgi:hypothetical protein
MGTQLARLMALGGMVVVVMAFTLAGFADTATAPGENDPELVISDKPNDVKSEIKQVILRPNQTQEFYLFVRNPSAADMKVTMRVLVGDKVLASVAKTVAAGKTEPFPLKKEDKAKPKDAKGPAEEAKADDGRLMVEGTPRRFTVALFDDQGNPLGKPKTMDISLLRPSEYIKVSNISFKGQNNRAINKLVVDLKADRERFSGPPCPVELKLSPDFIPGLKLTRLKDASLESEIDSAASEANLYAANLVFDNREKKESGLVFITVDRYERAFIYDTTFARNASPDPQPVTGRRLAVERKRYFNSETKKKYEVVAQVDGVSLDDGVTVELGLDLPNNGKFGKGQTAQFKGPRSQQVWLLPGSLDGALSIKTEVTDWRFAWDVNKVVGERTIRARLLDDKGKTLLSTVGKPVEAVTDKVTFVDTPPEGVKIEAQMPVFVQKDTEPLEIRATTTDPKDLIKEVNFFVGKPEQGKDGPVVPKTVTTVPGDLQEDESKGLWWTAKLPLPPGLKGPVEISVQFANQVDLSSFNTAVVQVVAPAVPVAATTGTITGKVKVGNLPQPNVAVTLKDPKGKVIANATTNVMGEFEFKKVQPGDYKVFANKDIPKRKGSKDAKVNAGETTKTEVELEM